MIIDTSALVAIARQEPTAKNLEEILLRGTRCSTPATVVLELAIALPGVRRETIEQFLAHTRIDVLDIDEETFRWALYAHERYGRGSGSLAKLNFGGGERLALFKATRRRT